MPYPRTIRNFNAFLNGTSYMGKVKTGTLPVLKLNTEGNRGAGMDAPVDMDMGMETMTTKLVFKEWIDPAFTAFGTRERIVLRPAAMGQDDFTADTFIFTCGGRITEVEPGELGGGNDSPLTLNMSVDFYEIEKNGKQLIKIDVENGVRIIGGVDQLGEIRTAMGL